MGRTTLEGKRSSDIKMKFDCTALPTAGIVAQPEVPWADSVSNGKSEPKIDIQLPSVMGSSQRPTWVLPRRNHCEHIPGLMIGHQIEAEFPSTSVQVVFVLVLT